MQQHTARFHLPGLFEFYDFYKVFLPLWREHREYFYDWCEIASIYGAPAGCIWGGGRVGFGGDNPEKVAALMEAHGISARLTFSNSLIRDEHLNDRQCNDLCTLFGGKEGNGVIIYSDLLLKYLQKCYSKLHLISSTTKVLTNFSDFRNELNREEFRYVVPDFRLNRRWQDLDALSDLQKDKVEFLCNECCHFTCRERKACYENVSRKALGEPCPDHICHAPEAERGYRFSAAMKNPGFIGIGDIRERYLTMGFSNFKIEGRSLGSAVLLEFLLHYLTKPECQLEVREALYLDSSLDLF